MQGSYPEGQCEILTFINLHIFLIGKRQIPEACYPETGQGFWTKSKILILLFLAYLEKLL